MAPTPTPSNSEQIFIDMLGIDQGQPTEDQWKVIRSLLGSLSKAGFAIDDVVTAPFIMILAWSWAHSTGRADVTAAVKAAMLEVDLRNKSAIPAAVPVDHAALAKQIAAAMPPQVATTPFNMSSLKEAVKETISFVWLVIFGVSLGLFFWGGMYYGKRNVVEQLSPLFTQQAAQIKQNQETIRRLTSLRHGR